MRSPPFHRPGAGQIFQVVTDAPAPAARWSCARVRQVWPSLDLREPRAYVPYLLELEEDVQTDRRVYGGQGRPRLNVLCHRDDHLLVRDATLQPPGPRTDRERFVTRRYADGCGWEEIDHGTLAVRASSAPAPSAPLESEASGL